MGDSKMEDCSMMESHSTAAAFVDGGIQDASDDSCSICLEEFCDSDPSNVTNCKHEYHLHCILEWCQRSSNCPMCWQPVSLKDPASQELLGAVEEERNRRINLQRAPAVFRHPILGDFELQRLQIGSDDAAFEERILQHLAAAAAMRRTHRLGRREGERRQSTPDQAHPQYLIFSPNEAATTVDGREREPTVNIISATPITPLAATDEESSIRRRQSDSYPTIINATRRPAGVDASDNRASGGVLTRPQDAAGPSDLFTLSESLKSRFQAASTRYRESITKSTRGWRERLFSRSNSITDIGSEVRREVNAGIAAMSRMMERLETGEEATAASSSVGTHSASPDPTADRTAPPSPPAVHNLGSSAP